MRHRTHIGIGVIALGVGSITLSLLATAPGVASAATREYVSNGTFTSTTEPWWSGEEVTLSREKGRLCAQVPAQTERAEDAVVGYNGIPLVKGVEYFVTFSASGTVGATVKTVLQTTENPYTPVSKKDTQLRQQASGHSYTYTPAFDAEEGSLVFQLGGNAAAWKFCVDDVSVTTESASPVSPSPSPSTSASPTARPSSSASPSASPSASTSASPRTPGTELLRNGGFTDTSEPWFAYETGTTQVIGGQLCSTALGALDEVWDAGVGQSELTLTSGETYDVSFTAAASPAGQARLIVQVDEEPYKSLYARSLSLTPQAKSFSFSFTATDSTDIGQLVVQFGGLSKGAILCLDDVSLKISEP